MFGANYFGQSYFGQGYAGGNIGTGNIRLITARANLTVHDNQLVFNVETDTIRLSMTGNIKVETLAVKQ